MKKNYLKFPIYFIVFAFIVVGCENQKTENQKIVKSQVTLDSLKLNVENTETTSSLENNSENQNTYSNDSSTKQFDEIQLTLTDGSLKKAKLYLGEPDKYERYFGHISKGFAIYYDRVANQDGNPKHLVLFLRKNPMGTSNEEKIEEIYSIEDNEKACFGIHCIKIINHEIYTNALDLIQDKDYQQL